MKNKIPMIVLVLLSLALAICLYVLFRLPAALRDILELAKAEDVKVYAVERGEIPSTDPQNHTEVYGACFVCPKKILVDKDSVNMAYTVGHEMGHYLAITYEEDYSEQRADEIAYELIFTGQYHKKSQ